MCMCVRMRMRVCLCVYVCVCERACLHTCICMFVCACLCVGLGFSNSISIVSHPYFKVQNSSKPKCETTPSLGYMVWWMEEGWDGLMKERGGGIGVSCMKKKKK